MSLQPARQQVSDNFLLALMAEVRDVVVPPSRKPEIEINCEYDLFTTCILVVGISLMLLFIVMLTASAEGGGGRGRASRIAHDTSIYCCE